MTKSDESEILMMLRWCRDRCGAHFRDSRAPALRTGSHHPSKGIKEKTKLEVKTSPL